MKTVKNPLFIVLFLIYVLYYIFKSKGIYMPVFIRNYLSDFLCLFLVNTIVLSVVRKIKGDNTIDLTVLHLLFSLLVFSVTFEFILPNRNGELYTRDWLDVVMYTLGLLLYYFWRKFRLFEK